MAKLLGPLLSQDATGTIGNHLGFVRSRVAHVARSIAKIRDRKRSGIKTPATAAQQTVRDRWIAGAAAWNALTVSEKATWIEAADALAITGFNLFMRDFEVAPPAAAIPQVISHAAAAYQDDQYSLPITLDTRGATKLLALVLVQSTASPTVADNMGNTWAPLGNPPPGWHYYETYPAYAMWMETTDANLTTSATHQAQFSVTGGWPTAFVVAIAPERAGALTITGNTFGTTSYSPFEQQLGQIANALVIAGLASYWETQPVPYAWASPLQPLDDIHTYGVWQGATAYARIAAAQSVTISASTDQTNFMAAVSGLIVTEQQ